MWKSSPSDPTHFSVSSGRLGRAPSQVPRLPGAASCTVPGSPHAAGGLALSLEVPRGVWAEASTPCPPPESPPGSAPRRGSGRNLTQGGEAETPRVANQEQLAPLPSPSHRGCLSSPGLFTLSLSLFLSAWGLGLPGFRALRRTLIHSLAVVLAQKGRARCGRALQLRYRPPPTLQPRLQGGTVLCFSTLGRRWRWLKGQ